MSNTFSLSDYTVLQNQLLELIDQGTNLVSESLKMDSETLRLQKNREKLKNDSFKILIVGNFKNGKSTFINSFLGSATLPAKTTPCTAVITEVKYGDPRNAVLYFRDDLPQPLPKSLHPTVLQHLSRHPKGCACAWCREHQTVPPLPVVPNPGQRLGEAIAEFATIPKAKDKKEVANENLFEKIELEWPLELLKQQIEVIDSPGLNEHANRTQVTMGYLANADAIIFVADALRLLAENEIKFIENDLASFPDVFFIINRWDMLEEDEEERKDTREEALAKLKDRTKLGTDGIYFVSAKQALKGREQGNDDLLQQSGIVPFENRLKRFLIEDKGRVKLAYPAKELKRIIEKDALDRVLPERRSMLEIKLDDLKLRYEQAAPKRDAAVQRRDQTKEKAELLVNESLRAMERQIQVYLRNLQHNVEKWIQDYTPKTQVRALNQKQSSNEITNEILEFIKDKIEQDQRSWLADKLQPEVTEQIQWILDKLNGDLRDFFIEIDDIKLDITGIENPDGSDIPVWERAAAAGVGFLGSGFAGAAVGSVEGLSKNFGKQVVTQFGIVSALSLFGLLNPLTIAGFIGYSLYRLFSNGGAQVVTKAKNEVAKSAVKQIADSQQVITDKLVAGIGGQLREITDGITASMDHEINDLESQVQSVINELENESKTVARRKADMDTLEQQLKMLSSSVDKFMEQLV